VALKLAGQWVWDSWFVRDGDDFHAFYLQASRGLGDPERRHRNVSVGHAVSKDLTNWQVLPDALTPSEPASANDVAAGKGVFDSYTTWTGSVVRDPSGVWHMFYTGTSREDGGAVQSIGLATSADLINWRKHSSEAILSADQSLYSVLADNRWPDEAFRDPWVFQLDGDKRWHMLMTARGRDGEYGQSAAAGHAISEDLKRWQLLPPLNKVNQGFGETEVLQFEVVDGVPVVLFCCGPQWLSPERLKNEPGGVYSLVVDPELQDVDFSRAVLFDAPGLYASRLIRDAKGCWKLIGFLNYVDGVFVGELSDPIAVTADPVRGLVRRH
jgi:beta-fructofuranosidase